MASLKRPCEDESEPVIFDLEEPTPKRSRTEKKHAILQQNGFYTWMDNLLVSLKDGYDKEEIDKFYQHVHEMKLPDLVKGTGDDYKQFGMMYTTLGANMLIIERAIKIAKDAFSPLPPKATKRAPRAKGVCDNGVGNKRERAQAKIKEFKCFLNVAIAAKCVGDKRERVQAKIKPVTCVGDKRERALAKIKPFTCFLSKAIAAKEKQREIVNERRKKKASEKEIQDNHAWKKLIDGIIVGEVAVIDNTDDEDDEDDDEDDEDDDEDDDENDDVYV
jgi:hypothetical protein